MAKGFGLFANAQPQKPIKAYADKRYNLRDGESAELIVLTKRVEDIITRYEHSMWSQAAQGNRTISSLKMPCASEGEPDPAKCRGCSAAIFNSAIKRTMVGLIWVVDLRVIPDQQGRQWPHTKKQWAVRYDMAALLADKFGVPEINGNIEGLWIRVYRNGKTSPACGNSADILGRYKIPQSFYSSPRVQWLVEKYAKAGQQVTIEQAAADYFRPGAEAPVTPERWYEFISFANRLVGPDQQAPLTVGQPQAGFNLAAPQLTRAQVPASISLGAPLQTFKSVPQPGALPASSFAPIVPSMPQSATIPQASIGAQPLAPLVDESEEEDEETVQQSPGDRFGYQQPQVPAQPAPTAAPVAAAVLQSAVHEFGLVTEVKGEVAPVNHQAPTEGTSNTTEEKKAKKTKKKVTASDFDALTK